jgi:hypothetical protein
MIDENLYFFINFSKNLKENKIKNEFFQYIIFHSFNNFTII